jgi:hypothetical protein
MKCGDCTLCCKLLELHDIPSSIGEYCKECEPGVGCKIHGSHPKECKTYKCMWLQMYAVKPEMRPDKCYVIFDKISDDVICGRLEKGHKLSPLITGQIASFVNEGFSVIVFRDKEHKTFLSRSHTEQYVLEAVNDRSKLH